MKLLRQLADERKQTIIMVTHEPEHKAYADRVIKMRDGLLDAEERVRG
jgi:putative ABC transport system ATP-binding protein